VVNSGVYLPHTSGEIQLVALVAHELID